MKCVVRLPPVAQLAPLMAGGELVAFNVGPDGVVYLVVALRPTDYRYEQPGWASFAKTVPERPQTYRVVGLSAGNPVLDVTIENEPFNIHDIQPVGSRLLLVCARSRYRGPDDFDKNGRLYTRGGKFVRGLLLGDGIQSTQATSDGMIWTSYFDEGVFGNFGWPQPVGAAGLVAWLATGRKRYEFQPPAGLDTVCDCYALNVASEDDVWLYYYTEFPLVKLHRREVAAEWKVPVEGSHAFAVGRGYVLFRGGYDDSENYHLLSLGVEGKAKRVATFQLRDAQGKKLVPCWMAARGDSMHFVNAPDGRLYRFDVPTAVTAMK